MNSALKKIFLFILVCTCLSLHRCAQDASAADRSCTEDLLEWNSFFLNYSSNVITQESRELALLNLCVHDAVNSIDSRFSTFVVKRRWPKTSSCRSAIATCFHRLFQLFLVNRRLPSYTQSARSQINDSLTTLYDQKLSLIADERSRLLGVQAGEFAASEIWNSRLEDGWNANASSPVYVPQTPGQFYLLPGQNISTQDYYSWGYVRTFSGIQVSQLQVAPPPEPDDQSFVHTLKLTQRSGSTSATISQDERQVADFWASANAHRIINPFAWAYVRSFVSDLHECARLLALLNAAVADATVANTYYKNLFNYWRPFMAIRDGDGTATTPWSVESNWTSYRRTPPTPEYPAAHPAINSAGVQILRRIYGVQNFDRIQIKSAPISPELTFTNFDQIDYSVQVGRVYSGAHFLLSCNAGTLLGRRVADEVYSNLLKRNRS
eukprot:TRINITY_DN531_c0_g2_i2.p1 TRINITY_DN531_c0_g2~~TRINITY_DN531_c0_g2_i2.p1  ORF type:complete len:437 (-),score=11.24 TRINITY_DN531_c0_g2_i2:1439-2749(-)